MRDQPRGTSNTGMEPRFRSLVVIAAAISLLVAGGCGGSKKRKKPKAYEFPVEVKVKRANKEGLSGVPVKIDGTVVGYTDKKGTFKGVLRERAGNSITLATGEVDGFRYVGEEREKTVKLNTKKNLSGQGRSGVPVILNPVVESTRTSYLVWIRATCDEESMDAEDCQGLPVELDGDEIGETDVAGVVHTTFEAEPSGERTLAIETPDPPDDDEEGPTFEPEEPEWEVQLDSDPTVFWGEQSFEDPEADDEPAWRSRRRHHGGGGSSGGGGGSSSGGGSDSDDGGSDDSEDDGIINLFDKKKK